MRRKMKKKKLRLATKRQPVKSHIVVLVPRHAPLMAILNYHGSMAIVMFFMHKEYDDDTHWYTKMDVQTLRNEYGTKFELSENWWGMGIPLTKDTNIDRLYKSAMRALKRLKSEGLITGYHKDENRGC